MGLRHPEDREHPVTLEAVDAPLILQNHVHHRLEQPIDQGRRILGMEVASGLQRAAHIGEEEGDEAELALRGRVFRCPALRSLTVALNA